MTLEQQLVVKEERFRKLEGNPKNIKCPGVVKRLRRELRSLRKKIEA